MKNSAILLSLLLPLAACAKNEGAAGDSATGSSTTAAMPATGGTAMKSGETGGMKVPESVRYDADLDVFFVSNINGNPSESDGNGFIAVIRADSVGVTRMLFESGKAVAGGKAVTLNAPKGMAIVGDTLWVADITVVRAINKRTGASIADVTVPGSTFLNDVAVGPDGAIYVTDTGIRFDANGGMTHPGTNRIFRISGRAVTTVAEGDSLRNPNGIAWDASNSRWVLAPFDGTDVQTLASGATVPAKLASGPGQYDGLEILPDGRILVSSWADGSVYMIRGGAMTRLVSDVSAPADLGFDTKRNVLAIPRFNDGKVEFYMLH